MDNSSINNFFNGNISEEDRKKFLEWIRSEEAEHVIETNIREYFNNDHDKKLIWNDKGTLETIKARIRSNDRGSGPSGQKKINPEIYTVSPNVGRSIRHVFLKSAAAILILISTSYFFVTYLGNQKSTAAGEQIENITKVADRGQKLSIYLSDGSKVMLNSESKISYPREFSTHVRKVKLEGEAFFEITKNPDRPFVVQTGEYETVVLGTVFIVTAKPQCEQISVALKSGEVYVRKNNNENAPLSSEKIHLTPGNIVTIDLSDGSKDISNFDINSVFDWTNNTLFFKEEKLEDVFKRLEVWYNVKFEFNSKYEGKKHIKYSGKFENESLENVLIGLSYVNDFEYNINGKIVNINFR